MKKFLSIILIVFTLIPLLAEGNVYEFSEKELEEYTSEIITDAYNTKDLEIADLKKQHELEILDKDFLIDNQKLVIQGDAAKILSLEIKNNTQSALLSWAPVVIVGSIAAGLIGGILLSRNI